MLLPRSRITSQGQISVPSGIRRILGAGPGSLLEWQARDGQVVVRRAGKFSSQDLHSVLFPGRQPTLRTLSALKEGITRHIKSRYAGR